MACSWLLRWPLYYSVPLFLLYFPLGFGFVVFHLAFGVWSSNSSYIFLVLVIAKIQNICQRYPRCQMNQNQGASCLVYIESGLPRARGHIPSTQAHIAGLWLTGMDSALRSYVHDCGG